MRKEMVIRMHTASEKGHSKAIKVAAAITGVESVTIAGEDKNLLLVIGVGIDSNLITEKLRRKVGHAEVVELRTVDAEEMAGRDRYHLSPSPYEHGLAAPARDLYYTGGYPQAVAGARDVHYYTGGSYAPTTMGERGYYGGGYPGQYQQQHDYFYYPAAANTHTVVHHEYSSDPNNCSIAAV